MDQADEFFVTGLEKYLDAKAAVNLFEKEVQQRVKTAIDGSIYKAELTELFDKHSLKDYLYSGLPKRVQLGQQALFTGCGILYFFLEFRRDNGNSPVFATVSFWRDPGDLLTPLWNSIEASTAQYSSVALNKSRTALSMTSSQPCADWDSCKRAFDEVLASWLQLWKGLGGLPKFPAASADDSTPVPDNE